jgi:hypothetical protein
MVTLYGTDSTQFNKKFFDFSSLENFLEPPLIIISFGGVGCEREVVGRRDWRLVTEA